MHRYASDGVVLTMLLHMARHWAFDRYRGFRWFSWVSGMVLLWLVYVAGINGYMLPWDRLAKFTVIATAEWFDWLPVFNGTLVRNFIFEENVNDRLFSLLSFIHIGVPLAVLAILWVHTQRVPQARTSPPLPIMLVLTAALIVLSALKPQSVKPKNPPISASTGSTCRCSHCSTAGRRARSGCSWARGARCSFFCPGCRRRSAGRALHAGAADNRIVAVRQGETLLDAGLREGIALPFDCRNGGCGECKATLRSGSVDFGAYQPGVLTSRSAPPARSCRACARRARTSSWNTSPPPRRAPRRSGRGPRPWKACSASRPT